MDKQILGIRKLALLNSGGYARGEFPLDRALSISGPNNMGKSTVINALQFPFLCDRRHMDFPTSDKDTLEFYFPNENSFIVSEARTEFGTFVLGAAGLGKARGNEYTLFAYQKELDIEGDYLVPHQGSEDLIHVRTLKELKKYLAVQDVWLKEMRPKEMLDVLAGVQRLNNTSMVGVFRLENIGFLPLFVEIFKNLLQMKDLDMEKMKTILLDALLPNWSASTKNILKDYRRFDDEIRIEKRNLETAKKLSSRAQELALLNEKWDELYQFITTSYHHITSRYSEECEKQQKEIVQLKNEYKNIEKRIQEIGDTLADLNEKRSGIDQAKKEVAKLLGDLKKEKQFFGLLSDGQIFSRENLVDQKADLKKRVEGIIVNLKLAEGQSPQSIKSQIKAKEQEISKKKNVLASLKANLVSELKDYLKQDEIQNLLKLFNRDLFLDFKVNDGLLIVQDGQALMKRIKKVLSKCQNGFYQDENITINLREIEDIDIKDYLNKDNIEAGIEQLLKEIENLKGFLQTAEDRDKQKQKKEDLERQIEKIDTQIKRFDAFQIALEREPGWHETLKEVEQQLFQMEAEYKKYYDQNNKLQRQSVTGDGEIRRKEKLLNELSLNMKEVKPLSGFDEDPMAFEGLSITLEDEDFNILVNRYVEKRKQAITIKEKIYGIFEIIEANDGFRFVHGETIPEQIKSLCSQTDTKSIEQYEKQTKNIEDSHSLIIGASLKSLVGKLEEFSAAIRTFNRSINKNPISNLKEIKFFLEENSTVLRKIRALIDSEPESLFSRNSNEKFKQLMETIESGIVLNLPNLFSLCISIELKNGKQVSFYGKSKIESSGTDLTIKAVLNIMILKKILRQKSDQVLNIPIYIDEAGQIDSENQKTLIKACEAAGFVPVFASVEPQETAHYWIGLNTVGDHVYITPDDWFTLERIETEEVLA